MGFDSIFIVRRGKVHLESTNLTVGLLNLSTFWLIFLGFEVIALEMVKAY